MNDTQFPSSAILRSLYHLNGILVFTFFTLTFVVWGGTGYPMAIALLFSPVGLWLTRHQPIPKHIIWFCVSLFTMFAIHWWVELRDDSFKLSDLDHPMRYVLFIPILLYFYKVRFSVNWLWAGVCIAGLICGYLSISTPGRAQGPFNTILWGDFSLVIGMFLLALLVKLFPRSLGQINIKSIAVVMIVLISMIGACSGILLSGSRGAWLTAVLLTGLLAIYSSVKHSLIVSIVAAAVIVLLSCLAYLIPQTTVKARVDLAVKEVQQFELGKSDATSTGLRLQMWYTALIAFKESPITGLGDQGLRTLEAELVDEGVLNKWAERQTSHQHNDLLDALAKGGLIGFATTLLFYINLLNVARNSTTDTKVLMTLLALSFIGFGLTNTMLIGMNSTMFLLAITSFLVSFRHLPGHKPQLKSRGS